MAQDQALDLCIKPGCVRDPWLLVPLSPQTHIQLAGQLLPQVTRPKCTGQWVSLQEKGRALRLALSIMGRAIWRSTVLPASLTNQCFSRVLLGAGSVTGVNDWLLSPGHGKCSDICSTCNNMGTASGWCSSRPGCIASGIDGKGPLDPSGSRVTRGSHGEVKRCTSARAKEVPGEWHSISQQISAQAWSRWTNDNGQV